MTSVRSLQAPSSATRRVEFASGATAGSGTFTYSYVKPFPAGQAPLLFVNSNNMAANQWVRIVSQDENGFTVQALQRNSVNLLGIDVLLATTVTANGINVDIAAIGRP